MWVNALYSCGQFSDVCEFRSGLKSLLDIDKLVVADGGYIDEQSISLPGSGHSDYNAVQTVWRSANQWAHKAARFPCEFLDSLLVSFPVFSHFADFVNCARGVYVALHN